MKQERKFGKLFGLARSVYRIRKAEKSNKLQERHPEVEYRLDVLLRDREARERHGLTAQASAVVVGVPEATVRRWNGMFFGNQANLVNRSRRPLNFRRRGARTPELGDRIVELRTTPATMAWGKCKLGALLRSEGWEVSDSSVGRVVSELLASGAIERIRYGKRVPGCPPPRRHARRGIAPKASVPGEVWQMDTTFVRVDGRQRPVVTAIDVVSRRVLARAVPDASATAAADFLAEMIGIHGAPNSIQTDGGSEFRGAFEDLCEMHKISLYVLPPKSPKLNAKIESWHGCMKREMINTAFDPPETVDELNDMLDDYCHLYWADRPHGSLGYLTPMAYSQLRHSGQSSIRHMC